MWLRKQWSSEVAFLYIVNCSLLMQSNKCWHKSALKKTCNVYLLSLSLSFDFASRHQTSLLATVSCTSCQKLMGTLVLMWPLENMCCALIWCCYLKLLVLCMLKQVTISTLLSVLCCQYYVCRNRWQLPNAVSAVFMSDN